MHGLALQGSYQTSDGKQLDMVDVWFATAQGTTPPQISDLLSDAPAAALPGAEGTSPQPGAAAASIPGARNSLEEELLRSQQQPLV